MKRLPVHFLFGLVCLFGPFHAHAAGGLDLARKIISPDAVLARASQLDLTPEQRSAVEQEQTNRREAVGELNLATRRATDALIAELSREKPDESAVLARFDALNAAETGLKRERLKTTVRLMRILTAEQLAKLESAPANRSAIRPPTEANHVTIPEMLQQVRTGIEEWKNSGRDLTEINALWAKFRQHAEAREHQQARQTLQELIAKLSAPPPAPQP